VLSAGNGLYERVLSEVAKVTSESLQVIIAERLIRKGENTVLNPRLANIGNKGFPKLLA
jgi:hypothetical protein